MTTGVSADASDPETALEAALADRESSPRCAVCPAGADFFLYEPDRVAKFVCWEHVSPVSADVGGDSNAGDRPVALRLEE